VSSGFKDDLIPTIDYAAGKVEILDQTLLPEREQILEIGTVEELAEAIRSLRVRGAPAIGIAGAYGILLALEEHARRHDAGSWNHLFDRSTGTVPNESHGLTTAEISEVVHGAARTLEGTRPTAVNLFWALDTMKGALSGRGNPLALLKEIGEQAYRIHNDEIEIEAAIGRNGEGFIGDGMRLITHCNAGGLAAAGFGTALAVIYTAFERGKRFRVYADETRPLLQGARLTAWELDRRGIEVAVICDSAAATLCSRKEIDMAIVGADRIAGNGDVANKIGTLGLAVICEKYGIPFYVAAPWSTFDIEIESGAQIPIEERPREEIARLADRKSVPDQVPVFNPAFDITPAALVTAIITERGVIERPGPGKIAELSRKHFHK
jgi:methylthioribose-1-phosphate isomerase